MIVHGVVSSMMMISPPSAVAYLALADFMNGEYRVGSTSVTAADVVSQPGWITANGLEIPEWTQGGAVHILGDLLAVLTPANWTIVLEYEEMNATAGNSNSMLNLSNGVDFSDGHVSVKRLFNHTFEISHGNGGAPNGVPCEPTGGANNGIHRIAATRTDALIAIAADGTDVNSFAGTMTGLALSAAVLGGEADSDDWSWEATRIRSLTVYAPKDTSELLGLSALV